MTLCSLVTVFAETKSVTKSRLHCTFTLRLKQKGIKNPKTVIFFLKNNLTFSTFKFVFAYWTIDGAQHQFNKQSQKHIGTKISERILPRAELVITLCYEIQPFIALNVLTFSTSFVMLESLGSPICDRYA